MKLIWIHQNIKGEWTDDECLEFAKTQRNKQLAADLAVYRKRLLEEADWLEGYLKYLCNNSCGSTLEECRKRPPYEAKFCHEADLVITHIAALREEGKE